MPQVCEKNPSTIIMTPTPTAGVFLPPVMDNIYKKSKYRKVSLCGPQFVVEGEKFSYSWLSLRLTQLESFLTSWKSWVNLKVFRLWIPNFAERKKSASLSSLIAEIDDEGEKAYYSNKNNKQVKIKSNSVMHYMKQSHDDLALHQMQLYRHSDNNHKKKHQSSRSLFDCKCDKNMRINKYT